MTDAARAVAGVRGWYHTMEVAPGVVTPGWFDLRPVLDRLPWPDVAGKRCLDVGTNDGHLAFELERRGAAEVVATDIADHADWDAPPRHASGDAAVQAAVVGTKGKGFEVAASLLESKVQRRFLSVYDLSPDVVGTFDVVVCGALLLHLRDPLGALAAIRSVCSGVFLSVEEIDLDLTVLRRRRPVLRLRGEHGQWFVPNAAAHRHLLDVAGFDLLETTRPFARPFGPAHPPVPASAAHRARWALLRERGVPMTAVLARPAQLPG